MITVKEYLVNRFSKSNALTLKEAKIIGLPWPMKKGWPEKYGQTLIFDGDLPKLNAIAGRQNQANADALHERKERKRLKALIKIGAISQVDFVEALKQATSLPAPISKPKPPKTKPNDRFYESREWRELRYKALVKHGPKCQCCGATRGPGVVLHVDHVKPRSKFPALQLELENLQILCADCNIGKSNKDQTDWRENAAVDKKMNQFSPYF